MTPVATTESKVTIEPLGSNVLILPDETIKESEGGLYIPDTAQTTNPRGTIVAVGTKVEFVKPNDRVKYSTASGQQIEEAGIKYLLMHEMEILCKITH